MINRNPTITRPPAYETRIGAARQQLHTMHNAPPHTLAARHEDDETRNGLARGAP